MSPSTVLRVVQAAIRRPLSAVCLFLLFLCGAAPPAQAGPRVALYHASADAAAAPEIQRALQMLNQFDKVDVIDNATVTSQTNPNLLALFQMYDAVVVTGDSTRAYTDGTGVGNVLSSYADGGGGVVVVNSYVVSSSGIFGNFQTRYFLTDNGTLSFATSGITLGMKQAHPILNGINTISTVNGRRCIYMRSPTVRPVGTVVASWSDGQPLAIVGNPQSRNRVDLNMSAPSWSTTNGCHDPNDDSWKLIANAINFVASPLRPTPSAIDFGDVGVGVTSAPQTVQVTNTGSSTITLNAGAVSGPEFIVSAINFPVTLNPNQSFSFELSVRPSAAGARTGFYTLTPSGNTPSLSIALRANGLGPVFAATPATVDFGGITFGQNPPPITVLLRNAGGGDLTLTALNLTDSTNFGLDMQPTLPNILRGGAVQSVNVVFRPQMAGRFSAQLQVSYTDQPNGPTRVGSVTLTGSAGSPRISAPGTLTLRPARVGRCGATDTITVTNNGFARLNISNIEAKDPMTGMATAEFKLPMTTVQVAPNGGFFDIPVQFCPSQSGKRVANIVITSDDPMSPTTTVRVEAIGTTATINLDVTSLDFGTNNLAPPTCGVQRSVQVSNMGTDNLILTSIVFDGAGKGSYFLNPPFTGNRTVAPGQKLPLTVLFCASAVGTQAARMIVTSDVPSTNEVALTGVGTGPKITANPTTIDFGNVFINTLTPERSITLKNEGDKPIVFGKAALNQAGTVYTASGLPVENSQLMPGATLELKVRANVKAPGAVTASIDIAVNDPLVNNSLKINLSVAGSQAMVSVDPKSINFGTGSVGGRSMARIVNVNNPGDQPLTGLTLSLSGASGDFLYDSVGDTIPAKGQVSIKVYFKPMLTDARTATLSINAVGLGTPETVQLTGLGVLPGLACSRTELDFGSVALGMEQLRDLTCTNQDATAADLDLVFESDGNFALAADSPTSIPASSAGEAGAATLKLSFKPVQAGVLSTNLTVRQKGSDYVIAVVKLGGVGLPPKPGEKGGCSFVAGQPASPGPLAAGLPLGLGLLAFLRLRRRRVASAR